MKVQQNTDPILQEVLEDYEIEKSKFLQYDKQSGSRWLNDDRVKSFLTSVVHRTREAVMEEAISAVPMPKFGEIVGVHSEKDVGWNLCRAATLQALEGLKKE